MKTIVINGANGYVASHFISDLLKNKYKVVALVRANEKSPGERMEKVLADINEDEKIDISNLKIFDYSLSDEDFSIQEEDLKKIFRGTVDYFHFAASLKYNEKSVDEIFSTNIEGVENSIKVFSKYATGSSRFFYIGTAYSCGRIKGTFEEKFYENKDISAFRNYYEQSKRFAENIIKKNIQKKGLNGHIVRLSQVVGNQKTGVTKTNYGIFDFAKRMFSLANRYPNEIIRVHVDPDSTQNLIPIDTVTGHLTKIIGEPEVPVIMNFVAKRSIRNNHIIETLNRLLPINIISRKKLDRKDMNSVERLISAGMSFSESYTSADIVFDSRKRDKFFHYTETGPDNNSVSKMLEYFLENLSEKKKKQGSAAA